jgi:RNA polymerase sigma-70 factor (ECF subfamily)
MRETAVRPPPEREQRDAELARLVRAAASGDARAFEAFYDATFASARTLARRVLRAPPEAVEDLLAEVYFEAWRGAARFDAARGSAMSWLLTLVRSRAVDALRHAAVHPGGAHPEHAEAEAPSADPAEALWQREVGDRLHTALAALSAPERWVLGLAYFRDLSQAEIAAATGLPLGTVKSHATRAQTKLRTALHA